KRTRRRNGQVEDLFQRQGLGTLQIGNQAGGPDEEEGDDQSVPHVQKDRWGGLAQGKQPYQEEDHEQDTRESQGGNSHKPQEDRAYEPIPFQLVDAQSPA